MTPAAARALRWLLPWLLLGASACTSLSPLQRERAVQVAAQAQSTLDTCERADACADPSPLRALGTRAYAQSSPEQPHHYALLLDYGQDALLARLSLVRSAQRSIDVQTYIFDEDDAGHLFLDELMAAARRGVKVRVLVDQLSALRKVETLAALAGAHANFEMRIYNPLLGRARISYPQYVLAAACCWRRLNQRMHNKLLLVDGLVGITGGRNYQDSYYDWDPEYNFRDRDLFVAGPVVEEMAASFELYWDARLTRSLPGLADVGRLLLREGVPPLPHEPFELPARPRHQPVRQHVGGDHAQRPDHRTAAEADELVHTRQPADDHLVLDHAMPGDGDAVDQDHVVPDPAVVGNVRVDHEEVVVADDRLAVFLESPMEGDVFADRVARADREPARVFGNIDVLRQPPQHGPLEDEVARPENRAMLDHHVGGEMAVFPELYIALNYAKRADGRAAAEPDRGIDNGRRMYVHSGFPW